MSRSAATAAKMNEEWDIGQLLEALQSPDHGAITSLTLAIFEASELEAGSSYDNACGEFEGRDDLSDLLDELSELESSMGMPEADALLFRGCFAATLMAYPADMSQELWPSIARVILGDENSEGEIWMPSYATIQAGLEAVGLDEEQRVALLSNYEQVIEYWDKGTEPNNNESTQSSAYHFLAAKRVEMACGAFFQMEA